MGQALGTSGPDRSRTCDLLRRRGAIQNANHAEMPMFPEKSRPIAGKRIAQFGIKSYLIGHPIGHPDTVGLGFTLRNSWLHRHLAHGFLCLLVIPAGPILKPSRQVSALCLISRGTKA